MERERFVWCERLLKKRLGDIGRALAAPLRADLSPTAAPHRSLSLSIKLRAFARPHSLAKGTLRTLRSKRHSALKTGSLGCVACMSASTAAARASSLGGRGME